MNDQQFEPVVIYNGEGDFLGYAIYKTAARRLQVTHIYHDTDDEKAKLNDDLEDLNARADLADHWPTPDDPEYVALINDENFMPIEYHMEEVIDDNAVQAMLENGDLDPDVDLWEDPVSGNIEWKRPDKLPMVMAKMPKDPAAPQARLRKAAETIALKRAASQNG